MNRATDKQLNVKVQQSLYRLLGFHEAEAPRFQDSPHKKVVRLSALRTDRLYQHKKYSS